MTGFAPATGLLALTPHPRLPIVYGVAHMGPTGWVHAWRLGVGDPETLPGFPSGGAEPCSVTIMPRGDALLITNYESGTLGVVLLGADGIPRGERSPIALSGTGPDPDRQTAAHPHQSAVVAGRVLVTDLGADLVRSYRPEAAGVLRPEGSTPVPSGSGPRHLAVLADGRIAVSGELAGTVLVGPVPSGGGSPGPMGWTHAPASRRSSSASQRGTRNYPGDIRASADGRLVYLANRGADSVSVFDVAGPAPRLLHESDTGGAWPQHLLVAGEDLLVAARDSDAVLTVPLNAAGHTDAEPRVLFGCASPVWLLPLL